MKLYLVRHAEAVDKTVDPERKLTAAGETEAKSLAAFLSPLKLQVDVIWHSGKARARQTAEAIAPAIESAQGLQQRCGIDPDDSTKAIAVEMSKMVADAMIVGHEPFLGKLASRLITGDKSQAIFDLDKTSVVCLENDGQEWKTRWMLAPELLRTPATSAPHVVPTAEGVTQS